MVRRWELRKVKRCTPCHIVKKGDVMKPWQVWFVVTGVVLVLSGCGRYRDKPACDTYFEPGQMGSLVPQGDGALVADSESGLVWFRCNVGEQFKSGTCAGDAQLLSLPDAKAYLQEVSAASGRVWRLPTMAEMRSLKAGSCENPAINTQAFPSVYSDSYWNSDTSSHSDLMGCSTNTFSGNAFCREFVENKRPFLMVLDSPSRR